MTPQCAYRKRDGRGRVLLWVWVWAGMVAAGDVRAAGAVGELGTGNPLGLGATLWRMMFRTVEDGGPRVAERAPPEQRLREALVQAIPQRELIGVEAVWPAARQAGEGMFEVEAQLVAWADRFARGDGAAPLRRVVPAGTVVQVRATMRAVRLPDGSWRLSDVQLPAMGALFEGVPATLWEE